MIKISTMPKDTLAELLLYISENEDFSKIEKDLHGGIKASLMRAAFRELAQGLLAEHAGESLSDHTFVKQMPHLSKKAKEVVLSLSSNDGVDLLTRFGLHKNHNA